MKTINDRFDLRWEGRHGETYQAAALGYLELNGLLRKIMTAEESNEIFDRLTKRGEVSEFATKAHRVFVRWNGMEEAEPTSAIT